jgi:hypothetical protein
VFDQVFRERIRLMPGARTLVRTMRSWGARAALVSGGFVPFVERVGAAIGFDVTQANRLETLNGRLAGRLLGPIRSPRSKLALLRQLTRVLKLQAIETLAVGDGANDLPMLRVAGLGVTFRPAPAVAAVAPITIRQGDLTALLYLQGVAKNAFVSSRSRRPRAQTLVWRARRAPLPRGRRAVAASVTRCHRLPRGSAARRSADRPGGRSAAARTSCCPAGPD